MYYRIYYEIWIIAEFFGVLLYIKTGVIYLYVSYKCHIYVALSFMI